MVLAAICLSLSGLLAEEANGGSPRPFLSSGSEAGQAATDTAFQSTPLRRDQPEHESSIEVDGGMMGIRQDRKATSPSMAGDDHAGHHAGSGGDALQDVPKIGTGGMGNGISIDRSEGGNQGDAGCCGARGRTPLYTFLATHPTLTESERQILAVEAARRIQQGRGLVGDILVSVGQAMSLQAMRESSQRLHEGLSLLDSGMAARAAAVGLASPQQIAFNWFNGQMGLPFIGTRQEQGLLRDLTPAHLLFMAVLILVSSGLLLLQALRLHRVQEILRTTQGSSGPPPQAPPSNPPTEPTQPSSPGGEVASAPIKARSDSARNGRWSGVLKVAQMTRETPQIVTFCLVDPQGGQIPFDFFPGQFVQLEVEPEAGKRVSRSYTIASAPTETGHLELTIKREAQGLVSRYLHDVVKPGELLKIAGPYGSFTFTGKEANSIVLLSGGVGITPMMSALRYLTDIVWPGDIYFVYSAHSSTDYIFRDEIEWLEKRHDNLHVAATMRRAPGTIWSGPEGRITESFLQSAVPDLASRRIHVCGPPAMMASMNDLLIAMGVPKANIHSEAFGPASVKPHNTTISPQQVPPAPPSQQNSAEATTPSATTITFSVSGISAPLQMDETVLESAEGANVNIPFSCRSGICGVCTTPLLKGQVSMAVEDGLAPADKAKGCILACQAKTTGGPLVVGA